MANLHAATDRQGVDLIFYGDSILKLFKDGKPKTSGRSNVFIDYLITLQQLQAPQV